MNAGNRRHLVSLKSAGTKADGKGGFTDVLTDLDPATLYVSIEPATTKDLIANKTVISWASHIVKGPFHPQVTTSTRIYFNGRRLDVAGVQNLEERSIDMTLSCVEQV